MQTIYRVDVREHGNSEPITGTLHFETRSEAEHFARDTYPAGHGQIPIIEKAYGRVNATYKCRRELNMFREHGL